MDAVDLSDYISGGYFIIKPIHREDWMPTELLPKEILSVSSCIGKRLDVVWGWNVKQHQKEILDFGILLDNLPAFEKWSLETDASQNGITSLYDAQKLMSKLRPIPNDIILIGIGLHHELVNAFLTYTMPPYLANYESDQANHERFVRISLDQSLINLRTPIDTSGIPLGFELVGSEITLSHSWLCSGIEKDIFEQFSIRPNHYGLINTYVEAKQVYDWIAEDELRGTRSEPEPYYPWLIVQYPIT